MGKLPLAIKQIIRIIATPNFAIIIATGLWLVTLLYSVKWQEQNVIRDDVISYYSYLPALFIYNDPSFGFIKDLPDDIADKIWLNPLTQVPKMTMGLSILYSPFFLIAHLYAKIFGAPTGYSAPYHKMLLVAGLFYGVIGLLFLKKVLLKYFSPLVVALSLISISFGTNLYHYTSYDGAMSHAYSFFLFCVFAYYSISWNKRPTNVNALILGTIGGLIILVRPSNLLIWVFPLMINIDSWKSFGEKCRWFLDNYFSTILVIISLCLIVLPQLLYWKAFTGEWIHYGYGNEGFYFNNPHITDGLFSYRKGWLLYTPIMLFSLIGLFQLKKYCKGIFGPIIIYVPLNIYLIFSWWCWWYGGSFSSRALIESYAILALPLAAFIACIVNCSGKVRHAFFAILGAGFILLNIFQSKQYDVAILHWDSMTKEAYWEIFAKSERPSNYTDLIKAPDYEMAIKGKKER